MKRVKSKKLLIPEPAEWSKEMTRSLRTWQTQIDLNGRIQMNVDGLTIYCYSAELASILIANELDAINLDTKCKVKIRGSEWLQIFVDGYRQGVEDFHSNHKASPDTLYGTGSTVYLENLIFKYNEAPNKLGAGWEIVKSTRLQALHHDTLNKIGYYSALTSEFLELKANNPMLFEKKIDKKPKSNKIPNTFETLFHNEKIVSACIDVLKDCEPPLIDENCRYIGKDKAALCLWIDQLERNGFIKKQSDRKVYAEVLALTFEGLSISDSLFAKENSRAKRKYEHQMKHKFHGIKILKNGETFFI